MKEYQSHKRVMAAKITAVEELPSGREWHLKTGDGALDFVQVDTPWIRKHAPSNDLTSLIGGYVVSYPGDGYLSWSPAQAFEEGYTALDGETAEGQAAVNGAPDPGWTEQQQRERRQQSRCVAVQSALSLRAGRDTDCDELIAIAERISGFIEA